MSEDAKNTFAKYIKENPIDYMWNNVLIMRSQARPTQNAHGRGDMPQTDQVDGEFMKPNATPVSEETNTMKKLNITKERFEKSRYFTRKYGTLEYVNESGNLYKTTKGKVLMFKESFELEPALKSKELVSMYGNDENYLDKFISSKYFALVAENDDKNILLCIQKRVGRNYAQDYSYYWDTYYWDIDFLRRDETHAWEGGYSAVTTRPEEVREVV